MRSEDTLTKAQEIWRNAGNSLEERKHELWQGDISVLCRGKKRTCPLAIALQGTTGPWDCPRPGSWTCQGGLAPLLESALLMKRRERDMCVCLRGIINHLGNYSGLRSVSHWAPEHSLSQFPGTSSSASLLQVATNQGSKLRRSSSIACLSRLYSKRMTILIGNWFSLMTKDSYQEPGLCPIMSSDFFFLISKYFSSTDSRGGWVPFALRIAIGCKCEKTTNVVSFCRYFI